MNTALPKNRKTVLRRVWFISIILGGLTLTVGTGLYSINRFDQHSVQASSTFTFSAPSLRLEGIQTGQVIVTAGPTGKISLERATRQGLITAVISVSLHTNSLYISQQGCSGHVHIGSLGRCNTTYRLQVPSSTSLITIGGDASYNVNGLTGNHNIQTGSGNLFVQAVSSRDLLLSTNNGSINVWNVHASHSLRINSRSGRVIGKQLIARAIIANSDTAAITLSRTQVDTIAVTSRIGPVSLQLVTPPSHLTTQTGSSPIYIQLPDDNTFYHTVAKSDTAATSIHVLTSRPGSKETSHNYVFVTSHSGSVTVKQ